LEGGVADGQVGEEELEEEEEEEECLCLLLP
jgi:hypothetical protein